MPLAQRIKIVVIGASWGGIEAATQVFSKLPSNLPVPVVLVQHQRVAVENRLANLFRSRTSLKVVAPDHGEVLEKGHLYVAPPGYHTLVDDGGRLVLSMHWPVHYCRPAVDELFYSAARLYGAGTLAIVLTGANDDGAEGLRYVAMRGGITVVQDPRDAEAPLMPEAAIAAGGAQHVLPLAGIAEFICDHVFGLQES